MVPRLLRLYIILRIVLHRVPLAGRDLHGPAFPGASLRSGHPTIYSLAWIVIFVVTIAAEFYLGGIFLKNLLHIPFWPTVFVLAAVVGTYTLLGEAGARPS